jgi:hypothetical protein
MQKELAAPDCDQLIRAFRILPDLTSLDAQTVAKDAFGVLFKGLDVEAASLIQDALQKEGVQTEVVEESELPVIPPAKLVKQLEILPAHVALYDPMGRVFNLAWKDILIIAAGDLRQEMKRPKAAPENLRVSGVGVSVDVPIEPVAREKKYEQLLLEIVLSGGISRYSIQGGDFVFNHLQERLTTSVAENFSLLVKDLAQYAPHAGLNRGAYMICENSDEFFAYPSKSAFFEEITWLLWRIAKAAAGV